MLEIGFEVVVTTDSRQYNPSKDSSPCPRGSAALLCASQETTAAREEAPMATWSFEVGDTAKYHQLSDFHSLEWAAISFRKFPSPRLVVAT